MTLYTFRDIFAMDVVQENQPVVVTEQQCDPVKGTGVPDDNEVITYLKHVVQEAERVMSCFSSKQIPSVILQKCKRL